MYLKNRQANIGVLASIAKMTEKHNALLLSGTKSNIVVKLKLIFKCKNPCMKKPIDFIWNDYP